MDLDELRGVQSTERQRDSLQHLRDSFYEDVANYIASRKHRRDDRASSVDNPFSDEQVRKLSDEIETAEEVVESLYERRVGKVVKLASFAAADAPVETDGMTTEEVELFEDLVARIEQNKRTVLEVLGGAADVDLEAPAETAPAPDAGDATGPTTDDANASSPGSDPVGGEADATTAASAGDVLADAMGGAGDGSEDADTTSTDGTDATPTSGGADDAPPVPPEDPGPSTASSDAIPGDAVEDDNPGVSAPTSTDTASAQGRETRPDDDRTTVRITRDVGQILGVDDREYELESEDVVTLPSANAGPLVDRDAAERLE